MFASLLTLRTPIKFILLLLLINLSSLVLAQSLPNKKTIHTIDSLNEIGFELATTDLHITRQTNQKAIELSRQSGYLKGLADAYLISSISNRNEGNYTISFDYIKKAVKIGNQINDVSTLAKCNYFLGDLHKVLGNFNKAKSFFLKAQKLAKQTNDYTLVSKSISNYSHVLMEQSEKTQDTSLLKLAIQGYLKSMEVGIKHKLPIRIVIAQINLANAYHVKATHSNDEKHYAKSFYYSNLSLKNAIQHHFPQEQATSYLNIAELKESLNQMDSAILYYKKGLDISEETGGKQWSIYVNHRLAVLYHNLNQLDLALSHAYQMLAYATYEQRKEALQKGFELLAQIAEKKGNYEKAYKYTQKSIAYKDTITNENNAIVKSGLIFQFENDQKDKEILLLQKDNLINTQNVKTQKLYRNGFIAGCLLLFLILLIVYSRFREKQRYTIDILKAKEEAENAKKAQEQFLANTSHEIRTPMNGVLGLTQYLLSTPLTEEQKRYLNVINNSTQDLLVIINDLLDIAQIKSGKLNFETNPFQPKVLFGNLEVIMQNKIQEKNLYLTSRIDANVPLFLLGDSVRVQQILLNLVSNALKFTDTGGITLELFFVSKNENNCTVCFSVTDTGVGIPEDKHDIVFNNFTQLDSDTNRKYAGAGIGLAICKQLVEQMGGTIELKSTPGNGTCINVTLTFGIAKNVNPSEYYVKSNNKETSLDNSLTNLKALVIDDNKINLQVARLTLERWGVHVLLATNGEEAVAKILAEKNIDVILMDLLMPGMDGFETTRLIRNHQSIPNPNIPVIAITASVIPGEKERCLECGMNDYISKPFKAEDLYGALIKVVNQSTSANQNGLIDLSHLYEKADGDTDFLNDIFATYVEEMTIYIEEMDTHVKQEQLKEIKAQAHKMKSPIALFGAMELKGLLQTIEDTIEETGLNKKTKEILNTIHQLSMQTVMEVKEELKRLHISSKN